MRKEDFKASYITLPVKVYVGNGHVCIATSDISKSLIGGHIVVEGKTFQDAETEFWKSVAVTCGYHKERSDLLDLYKPFQKGDWKEIGGTWFCIYGINVYFRYGKKMQHGWYVPFTKLNIMITNYWKSKTKKGEQEIN